MSMKRKLRRQQPLVVPNGPVLPATATIWHYTVAIHFQGILCDGVIKLARGYVPRGELPAVWFSMHPEWEETANKSIGGPDGHVRRGDRQDTYTVGRGLVRIAVAPETAPHDWEAFRRLSGISARIADGLESAARSAGADPADWRVSFRSVPRAKWIAVQFWTPEGWTDLPLDS